ncbi:MAG: DUF4258 domain-containing protein [Polyangiaceae bacterium]
MAQADDLLARIQRATRHGEVRPSKHARQQMAERNASAENVRAALLSAKVAKLQADGAVRLEGGTDRDGDELTVVVSEQDYGLRIVTVF